MSFKDMATPDASEHIGLEQTGDNIEAKRVANYVWNPTGINATTGDPTGAWERQGPSGGSTSEIQNVEIINALRALLQQMAVPSWFDPTTNTLRIGNNSVTVSSGTVTTVGTVTNLTNFGTNAADVMARDISINTWANTVRPTIS